MSELTLKLPESMTAYQIGELLAQFCDETLMESSAIRLDVSALNELDGAGYQIFLSFLKEKGSNILESDSLTAANRSQEQIVASVLKATSSKEEG